MLKNEHEISNLAGAFATRKVSPFAFVFALLMCGTLIEPGQG